jgi:hypothetical protein
MQPSGSRGELTEKTNSRVRRWLCPVGFVLLVAGDLLCLGNSRAWIAGPPTVACGAAALIAAEKFRERREGRRANSNSPQGFYVEDLLTHSAKEKENKKDQQFH